MTNRFDISAIFYTVPVTDPVTPPMTREDAHIKFNTGYKENGYTIDLANEKVYKDCHHHGHLEDGEALILSMVGEVSILSMDNYPEQEVLHYFMELVPPPV